MIVLYINVAHNPSLRRTTTSVRFNDDKNLGSHLDDHDGTKWTIFIVVADLNCTQV